jgi:diguanylate cyclase (GGDEF)-like protein
VSPSVVPSDRSHWRVSSRAFSRPYRRLLLIAALCFALLWTAGIIWSVAHDDLDGVAFGTGGLLLTFVVFALINRQQAHLRGLADTDPLTGLVNHRGFHEVLARELSTAWREGTQLCLINLDLDDFKAVNDNWGHPYGDEVLRTIATQLRRSVRDGDIAARIGGEEFSVILPRTDAEQGWEIAERARAAVASVPTHQGRIACSAGLAVYPLDTEAGTALSELADAALYWAKQSGKNQTRRFDPEHVTVQDARRQAAEIIEVLATPGAIEPVFQPVVALTTGRVVGYEALARFPYSPERRTEAWFSGAAASGLGPELEAAAIRAALMPLGREPGTHLAINVSPSGLTSDPVQAVLPRDLTDIVVELTEHEVFADDEAFAQILRDLRRRGARIAIDDAGAGYAGLKQVMWVQPDIVKLDLDLTRAIHADPARMALVESFVRFAGRVGATVCAEGIESIDELQALANLDVPWGQGTALGAPAAPWSSPLPASVEACRSALVSALRSSAAGGPTEISAGDRRLEHLSARLADARSRGELTRALGLIASELHADKICLSQWHPDRELVETLAESGEQAPDEFFALHDYPLTEKVLREQEAAQVLAEDPDADPAEVELLLNLGYRSMLLVPVIHRGASLGILEAQSATDRPWTRTEINRARIIANQLGSVIDSFFLTREGEPGGYESSER